MIFHTLVYKKDLGWSEKNFPDLDSENTLILIFSAPEFINSPDPIKELVKHYPHSKIMGCSSAGEISDKNILDHSMSIAIIKFKKTELKIAKSEIYSMEDSF